MGTELAVKRVRRSYSKQFKSEVVAECKAGDKSVSSVALKYGMNANIVHKWLRLAETGQLLAPPPSFIPLAAPVRAPSMPESRRDIQIDVARGDTRIIVRWPLEDAAGCATWLRDWLR